MGVLFGAVVSGRDSKMEERQRPGSEPLWMVDGEAKAKALPHAVSLETW